MAAHSYPELFPKTFTLLYCPFKEECLADADDEVPTENPFKMLQHLLTHHNISIKDPQVCFPFFDRYLATLPERSHLPVEEFTRVDAAVRVRLQTDMLRNILDCQERERINQYPQETKCLFCPFSAPSLPITFQHMFVEHQFNIGMLENLVMVPKFLSLLRDKVDGGICIFCEHKFPTPEELWRHMRSRQHYKIHSQNHLYDQFYISNYVTTIKYIGNDNDDNFDDEFDDGVVEREEEEDQNWTDLNEVEDTKTNCLFCTQVTESPQFLFEHLKNVHSMDLPSRLAGLPLEERFKYVNCLRYHQRVMKCPTCQLELETLEDWEAHFDNFKEHCQVDFAQSNQPEYLFPAFHENDDPLLYSLEFDDDDAIN